jgi:lysine-specific demethylase PHF8
MQAGTQVFINNLLKKQFSNCEEIIIKLDGSELKVDYFEKNGFNKPILVERKDNLDFRVPSNFTLNDLEQLIGSEYELEVIDVEKQQTMPMKVNTLKNYFQSTRRNKIFNLISLEISKTR